MSAGLVSVVVSASVELAVLSEEGLVVSETSEVVGKVSWVLETSELVGKVSVVSVVVMLDCYAEAVTVSIEIASEVVSGSSRASSCRSRK